MEITQDMCAFVSANTIAGICNKVWRTKFQEHEQIGLLLLNGYQKIGLSRRRPYDSLNRVGMKKITTFNIGVMKGNRRMHYIMWTDTAKKRNCYMNFLVRG